MHSWPSKTLAGSTAAEGPASILPGSRTHPALAPAGAAVPQQPSSRGHAPGRESEHLTDAISRLQAGSGEHEHGLLVGGDCAAGEKLREPGCGRSRGRLHIKPLAGERTERLGDLVLADCHD